MNLTRLQELLGHFPTEKIAVVGDFFLDQYLLIDPSLDEPSVETGLTAYQIVGKRHSPGAAGTVVNNLCALGVGTIFAVGMTGQDGEGLELRTQLARLGVNCDYLYACEERFTPTYTKPMLQEKGADGRIIERELNRLDLKNRQTLPQSVEERIIRALRELAKKVDAIMVMDQVSQENCGVITDKVRQELAELGWQRTPNVIYADSRERIAQFTDMIIKCNHFEVVASYYPEYDQLNGLAKDQIPSDSLIEECGRKMAAQTHRTVYVTLGPRGIWVFNENGQEQEKLPGVQVEGPIDICGAGDSTSSGIVATLCARGSYAEAAQVGNLVASITIQQLGTTGTAKPEQVLSAWKD